MPSPVAAVTLQFLSSPTRTEVTELTMVKAQTLSPYGWLVLVWVLVASFQYGYHISALNQIQAVLTCKSTAPVTPADLRFPTCIPMSDTAFSVVTSVFTLGGLLGSLTANRVMDRFGRKGALQYSSCFVVLGSGFMAIAPSIHALIFGRLLNGVGSGIALCVGPIFISEIAPVKIRGSVGVLTQFAIVIGLMVTQLIGLRMATPTQWRLVPAISSALSLIHILISPSIIDTPVWLKDHRGLEEQHTAEQRIWHLPSDSDDIQDVESSLLSEEPASPREERHDIHANISLKQLIASPQLRRPLTIVCAAMMSQQVSGINAVLYYSNDILSRSLPDLGPYISLGITIVNVLMTFPPMILIDRWGRRTLLLISISSILLSLILVGVGLDTGIVTLSSVSILTFVMSFAIGLGPVPFVIIPEVSPSSAVSALSSAALSLNWVSNFFVGLAFLPLRNALSGGNPTKEGRVFFVFAAALFVSTSVLFRNYRG
ncbi:general substrate transporter [Amylostereum chailletii]|nr:general substrate transporter [Amylostereum chailletii]